MLFLIDNNKTCIYFDKGKFDKYCVYINGRNKCRYAPTDDVYFNWIRILAKQYATTGVGIEKSDYDKSMYELLKGDAEIGEVIIKTKFKT